jgi:hypothetical protein
MLEFAEGIARKEGGTSVADAIDVKVPPEITLADLYADYGNSNGDGIGSLYTALRGRYVKLDLSEVGWKAADDSGNDVIVIPASTDKAYSYRSGNGRWKGNIVSIVYPPDLYSIGSNSLRNNGLGNIDLTGLSKLTVIGEGALRENGGNNVNFTGCTSLELIQTGAFNGFSGGIDLSPCTSLRKVESGFGGSGVTYIEFPASRNVIGFDDYCSASMTNCKYIRFRGPVLKFSAGWCNFIYYYGGSNVNNSIKANVHYMMGSGDGRYDPSSLFNYVMYHPDTNGYIGEIPGKGYLDKMDGRDSPTSHLIPLPYADTPSGYPDDVDRLRGDALLAYMDPYRGKDSIAINATGLDSYNGSTVTANIAGVSGTISGGALNLTIGTPASSDLKTLNYNNAQEITGYFNYLRPAGADTGSKSRFLTDDIELSTPEGKRANINDVGRIAITGKSYKGYTYSVNGRDNRQYGMPVIWPDDQINNAPNWYYQISNTVSTKEPLSGYPNYVMLELKVSGITDGRLERWGRSQYSNGSSIVEEVRVARWIYVDKDCTIYREQEGGNGDYAPMRHLWLNLRKGWNQIVAHEPYSWNTSSDVAAERRPNSAANATLGFFTVYVANGKTADDSAGRQIIGMGLPVLRAKDIPWSVRTNDAWLGITTQPLGAGIPALERLPGYTPDIRPLNPNMGNYRSWWRKAPNE